MKNLEGTGLQHNPCQGCEAYYTRDGLFGQCVMEIEKECRWIEIYDTALNRSLTGCGCRGDFETTEPEGNG